MAFSIVFCVILLLKFVNSQVWVTPAFIRNENEKRVDFIEGGNEGQQVIYMEENIEEPVTIAFLNYKGPVEPEISKFSEPLPTSNEDLGVSFSVSTENGYWAIVVNKPQDYDNKEPDFRYAFEIKVENVSNKVFLYLLNVDDQKPIIQGLKTPCEIPENFVGRSTCICAIFDADGVMDGVVKYRLTGMDDVETIFEFKDDMPSNGVKEWDAIIFTIKSLDYETTALYVFDLEVEDSGGNTDKARIVVRVADEPDMPPAWQNIFASVQLNEKEKKTYEVLAIDGDVTIKAEVNYLLESNWTDLFSIGTESGIITIGPIDRDALKREIFTFELTAFEKDDITSRTKLQVVTVIVEDINDHIPKITIDKNSVSIPEESTLSSLGVTIVIDDPDLGDHATYEVSLRDDKYSKAFQIIPGSGYQRWTFIISVINSELLDFEDPDTLWRNITLEIKSKEVDNDTQVDTKTIQVLLENWNDELPEFELKEYLVVVPENIKIGECVATVFATDKDYEDDVKHSLVGDAIRDTFTIDEETGVITTKVNNAFDFERQQVVILNIQAQDILGDNLHTVIAQLTINVEDVNDEQPKISALSGSISIKENQPDGTLVNKDVDIIANDPDTTAVLKFTIDWEESFAVKNGQKVEKEAYRECIEVRKKDIKNGEAKALLYIRVITPDNTPDYELFDTLNIVLIVEDTDQKIGNKTDTVRITINIEDENDNEPVFNTDTITSPKRVTENATIGTPISTIIATDADGSDYNEIEYSLRPADNETPENLVDIHPVRGELYVIGEIDADLPLYNLNYFVVASDGHHTPEEKITISVIDTNNKAPIVSFKSKVTLLEKSENETDVQIITVTDEDRDEAYNTPWFRFSNLVNDEVRKFFVINLSTGKVSVNYVGPERLDRDNGPSMFTIPFIVGDNYAQEGATGQHQSEHSFTVTLEDINDQAPVIQENQLKTKENLKKEEVIGTIQAIDKDEPNTDNTKIAFTIVKIENAVGSIEPPNDEPLFSLVPADDPFTGEATLIANRDLKGYYGTYLVHIQTNDFGKPQQFHNGKIEVVISKFNFEKPQIDFPKDGDLIFLSKEQGLNEPLYKLNGEYLETFSATDLQNEKWDISFSIDPETNPSDIFSLPRIGKSRAQLQLTKRPDYDGHYELKIIADCNCEGSAETQDTATIKIRFIDENSEPYFADNDESHKFTENTTGLGETQQLSKASYNGEGEIWDQFDINYFIVEDSSAGCFEIDKKTAELKLVDVLDREEKDKHTLVIVASKSPTGNAEADDKSKLTVHIEVIDVNDNPPNFDPKVYYGNVKQSDDINKVVKSVKAIDLDENDTKLFSIVPNSMQIEGEGIQNIEVPFNVDKENGNVHLNFAVKLNMNGYFTFEMQVKDEVDHTDTASVTIHVVSQSSSYTFLFENDDDTVKSKETEVANILGDDFEYICNIEKIEKSSNENGVPLSEMTEVVVHFIDPTTNKPIASTEIEERINNPTVFSGLDKKFREISLYLTGTDKPSVEENMEEELRAWLIGVSVVLGTLCVVLIIAFIVKTRSLIRRLNKLSTTEFGSQESGLNRIGVAAPNTNKHAIEGSNPVYNEEKKMPDVDTTSIGSGDSDLIGIEDNPNFEYSSDIFSENFKSNGKANGNSDGIY